MILSPHQIGLVIGGSLLALYLAWLGLHSLERRHKRKTRERKQKGSK